jgi:hypothetical protein
MSEIAATEMACLSDDEPECLERLDRSDCQDPTFSEPNDIHVSCV